VGIAPKITDAELLTLAVMQALLGYTSETGWLRYARAHLAGMFPNLPGQSGYNKRLRKLADTMTWLVSALAAQTSIAADDVWVADSTPVECARSRETVQRSDLAGWAGYGYCTSHSRFCWGLRLHLVCTLRGLPFGWALADAKADERGVFDHIVANTPALARSRPYRQVLLADKKTITAASSRPTSPPPGSTCSARPARARNPARATVPQTTTTGHRVGQRHLQRPARPRTPRRQNPGNDRHTPRVNRPLRASVDTRR
jgi:hypothetical protein